MSNIFEQMSFNNHETIVFCNDKNSGLKAVIAVHNTVLGQALGGCRFYPYATEADALNDVCRISKDMTYKASVAGLNLGGGKSVIIGDPKKLGTEALFRTFGRFVNSLNGKYITAEDVGTNLRFMEWISYETDHVTGIPSYSGGSGDPSPVTAHGTFVGIKSAVKKVKNSDSLTGIKIAVEGIGNVGYNLCRELYESGAKLYVSDIDTNAAKRAANEFKATVVQCADIYSLDVDVYAPCALGATLNDHTIPQLKCAIVAGAANNQLADEIRHATELKKRGILYAPDYVINAGGLINVSTEVIGGGKDHAWEKTEAIYNTLLKIYNMAEEKNITTAEAANQVAEARISEIAYAKNIYRGNS